jgi:CelD/BcsL family acetyltransferase involved in cellulose biosynthesis
MASIERLCICDRLTFQRLADEWNRLAVRTNPNSVFFRHEWFDSVWCWTRDTCDYRIVCVRRDGELIGICPLVLRRSRSAHIVVSVLEFLAVPDTQECTLLADPADIDNVVAALIDYISSREMRWDVMRLEKLRADSRVTHEILAGMRRTSFRVQVLDGGSNPGIGLEDDWPSYYSRRSRRLKKGNNLIVNRLKRDNKLVEIRCYDIAAAGDYELASLLRTLVSLSARSWKASTGLTLENQGPGAFITRLSEHAMHNSWLLVWVLTIDGEPAAMEYQLEFNGVVSGLRADYDSRFDRYSPGTLLNWRIIEQLFKRDASYYSLGPGSNQYKMRWAEEQHQLNTVVVYGTSVRGRAVHALEMYIRPLARRVMNTLKRRETGNL